MSSATNAILFSPIEGRVLETGKNADHFTNNQSDLCRSKRGDIGLRPPTAIATTTAPTLSIYTTPGFLSVAGWLCPKHHIRRNVCFFLADRGKEDREGPGGTAAAAAAAAATTTKRSEREATTGTTASAFFSGFKHPLHQPPPDLPFTPCRLISRSKRRTRSFPPSTSKTKGCVGCVFTRGSFSGVSSRSFRLLSLTSHSILRVFN